MNFKVTRLDKELYWFGAFQCSNEDFNLGNVRDLLPGMIIDKVEQFVGGFLDIYFHFENTADEALFILKAEALQQEQDAK
jgi:hypothetical protein